MNTYIVKRLTTTGWQAVMQCNWDDYETFQKVAQNQLQQYKVFENGNDVTSRYKSPKYTPDASNTKEAVAAQIASAPSAARKHNIISHYINNVRIDSDEPIAVCEPEVVDEAKNIEEPPQTTPAETQESQVTLKPADIRNMPNAQKQHLIDQAETYKAGGMKRTEIFNELQMTEAAYDELRKWAKEQTPLSEATTVTTDNVSVSTPTPRRKVLGVRR